MANRSANKLRSARIIAATGSAAQPNGANRKPGEGCGPATSP
jgi:hypothetical protein